MEPVSAEVKDMGSTTSKEAPKLRAPTTFRIRTGKEGILPVLLEGTDATEVFPYLPEINAKYRDYIRRQNWGAKGIPKDMGPTDITPPDVIADLAFVRNRVEVEELPGFKELSEQKSKSALPKAEILDGQLCIDSVPVGHTVVMYMGLAIGEHEGKLVGATYDMDGDGDSKSAFSPTVLGADGKMWLPATEDEYLKARALYALQANRRGIMFSAGASSHSALLLRSKEEVLKRFRNMFENVPEITVEDIMPVHLFVTGYDWKIQRHAGILREFLGETAPLAREGSGSFLYLDAAWQCWIRYKRRFIPVEIFAGSDGRFLISGWCQREITKSEGVEAYSGHALQHTLLTWCLGPMTTRDNHTTISAEDGLRKLRPVDNSMLDPGDPVAQAVAIFLLTQAKSLTQLETVTAIRRRSKWPCLYIAGSANYPNNSKTEMGACSRGKPFPYRVDIILPDRFINITGSATLAAYGTGEGNPLLYSTFLTKGVLKEHRDAKVLPVGDGKDHLDFLYNTYLSDPEEVKHLMGLLGIAELHPIEEKYKIIADRFAELRAKGVDPITNAKIAKTPKTKGAVA